MDKNEDSDPLTTLSLRTSTLLRLKAACATYSKRVNRLVMPDKFLNTLMDNFENGNEAAKKITAVHLHNTVFE